VHWCIVNLVQHWCQQRTFAASTKVFCWIYLGVTGQEERGAGWWVGVGGTGVSLNWRYNHKPCDHDPFLPPKKPLNPAKAAVTGNRDCLLQAFPKTITQWVKKEYCKFCANSATWIGVLLARKCALICYISIQLLRQAHRLTHGNLVDTKVAEKLHLHYKWVTQVQRNPPRVPKGITLFQTKWYHISLCFVCVWCNGFL